MGPEPDPRRRKRILALLLALALSLLLLEGAARFLVGTPIPERLPLQSVRANPYRGWEMVPGEHYTYQHRVHVNALGLRGPELGPKAAGELRVLFLGDSLTYGQGVADDETVPAALERELRARDPDRAWRVVNAGVRAYGTAQELGLLSELGARIQPDLVLLGWYWNDLSERAIRPTYEEFRERGEFVFDLGERMEGLARLRWHGEQLLRRSALVMFLHDLFSTRGKQVFAPEFVEAGFATFEGLLERFSAEAARLRALPVVVVFPDAHRLVGAGDTAPLEERAVDLARAHGLDVVELLPALAPLAASAQRLPILPFDGHYDAAANRAMAASLAERLLALGLPKRSG